jgi:hypothetical protein
MWLFGQTRTKMGYLAWFNPVVAVKAEPSTVRDTDRLGHMAISSGLPSYHIWCSTISCFRWYNKQIIDNYFTSQQTNPLLIVFFGSYMYIAIYCFCISRWDVLIDHNTLLLYSMRRCFCFLRSISIHCRFVLFVLVRFRHPASSVFDIPFSISFLK